MSGHDWRNRAACVGHNPETWTGEIYSNRDIDRAVIEEAKAICATCPVRKECLADALARKEAWTIRGGLTPEERDRLRRNGNRKSRAS